MYLKMAININGNSRGKPFVPSLSIVSLLTDQKINTEKNEARQNINSKPKVVVIDEAAGQLIASASAGINIYLHLLSFLLFRFFDITKLGPIKFIENKGGAFGIIFDDVLAGIFSALIILFIINYLI